MEKPWLINDCPDCEIFPGGDSEMSCEYINICRDSYTEGGSERDYFRTWPIPWQELEDDKG